MSVTICKSPPDAPPRAVVTCSAARSQQLGPKLVTVKRSKHKVRQEERRGGRELGCEESYCERRADVVSRDRDLGTDHGTERRRHSPALPGSLVMAGMAATRPDA